MQRKFDILLTNETSENKDIAMFSRQDENSLNMSKYRFNTPYKSTYDIGTYFRCYDGVNSHEFTIDENRSVSLLINIFNIAFPGKWVLYDSSPSGGNIFDVTSNSHISELEIGIPTWQEKSSGSANHIYGIFFVDDNTGWAAGWSKTILKTIDGGETWVAQDPGLDVDLYDIFFIDELTGWACGKSAANGRILHTANGGQTWTNQNNPATSYLYKIFFINANVGWCCGASGKILYTDNGGSTWTEQTSGESGSLLSVFFIDENTGWCSGTSGVILYTDDAGVNWTPQTSGVSATLNSIKFLSSNIGWITDGSGIVLHTINGGSSWTQVNFGVSKFPYGIYLLDENVAWIACQDGKIVFTDDGGSNWYEQDSGLSSDLLSVFMLSVNTGFICGIGGKILKLILDATEYDSTIADTNLLGNTGIKLTETSSLNAFINSLGQEKYIISSLNIWSDNEAQLVEPITLIKSGPEGNITEDLKVPQIDSYQTINALNNYELKDWPFDEDNKIGYKILGNSTVKLTLNLSDAKEVKESLSYTEILKDAGAEDILEAVKDEFGFKEPEKLLKTQSSPAKKIEKPKVETSLISKNELFKIFKSPYIFVPVVVLGCVILWAMAGDDRYKYLGM